MFHAPLKASSSPSVTPSIQGVILLSMLTVFASVGVITNPWPSSDNSLVSPSAPDASSEKQDPHPESSPPEAPKWLSRFSLNELASWRHTLLLSSPLNDSWAANWNPSFEGLETLPSSCGSLGSWFFQSSAAVSMTCWTRIELIFSRFSWFRPPSGDRLLPSWLSKWTGPDCCSVKVWESVARWFEERQTGSDSSPWVIFTNFSTVWITFTSNVVLFLLSSESLRETNGYFSFWLGSNSLGEAYFGRGAGKVFDFRGSWVAVVHVQITVREEKQSSVCLHSGKSKSVCSLNMSYLDWSR